METRLYRVLSYRGKRAGSNLSKDETPRIQQGIGRA
jgi:hypothetical protein